MRVNRGQTPSIHYPHNGQTRLRYSLYALVHGTHSGFPVCAAASSCAHHHHRPRPLSCGWPSRRAARARAIPTTLTSAPLHPCLRSTASAPPRAAPSPASSRPRLLAQPRLRCRQPRLRHYRRLRRPAPASRVPCRWPRPAPVPHPVGPADCAFSISAPGPRRWPASHAARPAPAPPRSCSAAPAAAPARRLAMAACTVSPSSWLAI